MWEDTGGGMSFPSVVGVVASWMLTEVSDVL